MITEAHVELDNCHRKQETFLLNPNVTHCITKRAVKWECVNIGPLGLPVEPDESDKTTGRVPPVAQGVSEVLFSTDACHLSSIERFLKPLVFFSGIPIIRVTLKNVAIFILSVSVQRQSIGRIIAPRRAIA